MEPLSYFLKLTQKKSKFFDYWPGNIETSQKKNEKKIDSLAKSLIKKLKKKKLYLAIMESCTGGGLANAITNVIGASDVFKGGFIVYSNQEKIVRGVPKKLIQKYSVYSPEVATAMAYQSIKEIKGTDIGVGITGSFSRPDPRNSKSSPGQIFIAVIFSTRGARLPDGQGSAFGGRNKFLIKCFLLPNLKTRKVMKIMGIYQAIRMIAEILR